MSAAFVVVVTIGVLIIGVLVGRLKGYRALVNRLNHERLILCDELNLATRILFGLEPFKKADPDTLSPLIAAARKTRWGIDVDEPTPVELLKNGLANRKMLSEAGKRPLSSDYADRPVDATNYTYTPSARQSTAEAQLAQIVQDNNVVVSDVNAGTPGDVL